MSIQCFKYTQLTTGIPFYLLQAFDQAICISVDSDGERTLYERYTVEKLDDLTPLYYSKKEWDIGYVITLYQSVIGYNKKILKAVSERKI